MQNVDPYYNLTMMMTRMEDRVQVGPYIFYARQEKTHDLMCVNIGDVVIKLICPVYLTLLICDLYISIYDDITWLKGTCALFKIHHNRQPLYYTQPPACRRYIGACLLDIVLCFVTYPNRETNNGCVHKGDGILQFLHTLIAVCWTNANGSFSSPASINTIGIYTRMQTKK